MSLSCTFCLTAAHISLIIGSVVKSPIRPKEILDFVPDAHASLSCSFPGYKPASLLAYHLHGIKLIHCHLVLYLLFDLPSTSPFSHQLHDLRTQCTCTSTRQGPHLFCPSVYTWLAHAFPLTGVSRHDVICAMPPRNRGYTHHLS